MTTTNDARNIARHLVAKTELTEAERGTVADIISTLAAEVEAAGLLVAREKKVAEREATVAAREVAANALEEATVATIRRAEAAKNLAEDERRRLKVETTERARILAAELVRKATDQANATAEERIAAMRAAIQPPEPGSLADLERRVIALEDGLADTARRIYDIDDED